MQKRWKLLHTPSTNIAYRLQENPRKTHVRVVSLIVCVHRHLLEVRHGGWIAVSVRLGHVIMGIISGRCRQTVGHHRVRRQIQIALHDRPFLR